MEISDKPASPKTLEAHKPAALVRIRPIPGDTTPFAESTRKNIFAYSNQKGCQHALTHSSKPLLATTSQSIIRRRSTFSPFNTPQRSLTMEWAGKSKAWNQSNQQTNEKFMHSIMEEGSSYELSDLENKQRMKTKLNESESTIPDVTSDGIFQDSVDSFKIAHRRRPTTHSSSILSKENSLDDLYKRLSDFKLNALGTDR